MLETESERELVVALRRGNTGAFDRVYELYRPRIFSFVVRLSKERMLAEDVVQETFVRLARRAPELRADTRLGPWLFTVARNLWISHLRINLLDAERLDRFALEIVEPVRTPFERAAANESQLKLERALAELPASYREALLLVGVEGYPPTDAAAIIGISPEAMRQRLSRARSALKRLMGRPEETKRGGAE